MDSTANTQPSNVRIQTADFDIDKEVNGLRASHPNVGAAVVFLGTVRDTNLGDGVSGLFLEHYQSLAEKQLTEIRQAAFERWSTLVECLIIHRVGQLKPQDKIVMVATLSEHRRDAFQSCEFVMDFLKTQAPIWKKETTPSGERWLENRDSDQSAQSRWHNE